MATQRSSEDPNTNTSDAPEKDSPLLDLSDAAVRRFIRTAKTRGYVTYDELNAVLGMIDDHDREFENTIEQLHTLVGGLSADRDPIGASIPQIASGTADLAALLQNNRPDLQTVIAETNRTMTQLDLGKDDINRTLERLPSDYKKLIRVGAYGNFFQFFLCANTFKFSGPDGTTIRYTTANHDTGRCAKVE